MLNAKSDPNLETSPDKVIVAGEGIWPIIIVSLAGGVAFISLALVNEPLKAYFYGFCGLLAFALPIAFYNSSSFKVSYEFSNKGFRVLTRGIPTQEFFWHQVVEVDGPLMTKYKEMRIEMDSGQVFLIRLNFTTLKQAFETLKANVDPTRNKYKAPWVSP